MAYIPDEVYKQLLDALEKSRELLAKYNERDELFLPRNGRGIPVPDERSYVYGLYNANKALIKRLETLYNRSAGLTQDRRENPKDYLGPKERRDV